MQFCPPACPSHSGTLAGRGAPLARCTVCGCGIYGGESLFYNGSAVICSECERFIDVEGLMVALGVKTHEELFEICGFSKKLL